MEFKAVPTDSIQVWDKNTEIRDTTPEDFSDALRNFAGKPQYDPLFVTPNDEGTFTCIAGNHRLLVYKELQIPEMWVRIIEPHQTEDGQWNLLLDGEFVDPEQFQTPLDALMNFAIIHNQPLAHYKLENIANVKDSYNLNWDSYKLITTKPLTIAQALKKFGIIENDEEAMNDDPNKNKKMVICPNCTHEFFV